MKFRSYFFVLLLIVGGFLGANEWQDFYVKVEKAANWLMKRVEHRPQLMVVLTAGVEGPLSMIDNKIEISSTEIPFFPKATVPGHDGKIIFGNYEGKDIVILKGRFHYYEGLLPQEVIFPYFVLQKMGIKALITVNAVGGIRKDLQVGDLFLVKDHINFLGCDALRGIAMQRRENQFTDLIGAYSKKYQKIAKKAALEMGLKLKNGIYMAIPGPCYETKAEVGMFRQWDVGTIGMSTIFEVAACRFLGIDVLALNCICDVLGAFEILTHEKVLEQLEDMGPRMSYLINLCTKEILNDLSSHD